MMHLSLLAVHLFTSVPHAHATSAVRGAAVAPSAVRGIPSPRPRGLFRTERISAHVTAPAGRPDMAISDDPYDVVVLGLGLAGLSSMYQLAQIGGGRSGRLFFRPGGTDLSSCNS